MAAVLFESGSATNCRVVALDSTRFLVAWSKGGSASLSAIVGAFSCADTHIAYDALYPSDQSKARVRKARADSAHLFDLFSYDLTTPGGVKPGWLGSGFWSPNSFGGED